MGDGSRFNNQQKGAIDKIRKYRDDRGLKNNDDVKNDMQSRGAPGGDSLEGAPKNADDAKTRMDQIVDNTIANPALTNPGQGKPVANYVAGGNKVQITGNEGQALARLVIANLSAANGGDKPKPADVRAKMGEALARIEAGGTIKEEIANAAIEQKAREAAGQTDGQGKYSVSGNNAKRYGATDTIKGAADKVNKATDLLMKELPPEAVKVLQDNPDLLVEALTATAKNPAGAKKVIQAVKDAGGDADKIKEAIEGALNDAKGPDAPAPGGVKKFGEKVSALASPEKFPTLEVAMNAKTPLDGGQKQAAPGAVIKGPDSGMQV